MEKHSKNKVFVKHDLKDNVEVFKGQNLHPFPSPFPLPHAITDILTYCDRQLQDTIRGHV